jgi:hypothetical protein
MISIFSKIPLLNRKLKASMQKLISNGMNGNVFMNIKEEGF